MPNSENVSRFKAVKKLLIIFVVLIAFVVFILTFIGQLFGSGFEDIYYSNTATFAFEPYKSYLDKYQYEINETFSVGDKNYSFRKNILYLVKDGQEIEIGNLKLNIILNICNGDHPIERYTLRANGKLYYVTGDLLYRIDDKLVLITQLKEFPEGFYVQEGKLYYAYGWEKYVTDNTLGGPVGKRYKRYRYEELDLNSLESKEITKTKYLELKPSS